MRMTARLRDPLPISEGFSSGLDRTVILSNKHGLCRKTPAQSRRNLRDAMTAALPPLFNPQFVVGENESILNGLEPALGMGLLSFRPLGRN